MFCYVGNMTDLRTTVQTSMQNAFEALGLPRDLGTISVSKKRGFQYQCNGALAAAKLSLIGGPQEIARAVLLKMVGATPGVEPWGYVTATNGFLNISVYNDALARSVLTQTYEQSESENVTIDFGGPNIAKEMHVGHLRSLVIGDSLQKILRYQGHRVTSDIHWGDWGLQMGMLVAWVLEKKLQPRLMSLSDLAAIYVDANTRMKSDPEFKKLAQQTTTRLQSGETEPHAIWSALVSTSKLDVGDILQEMNIQFTIKRGESQTHNDAVHIGGELIAKGLAHYSDDALIVPMPDEMPPLMFYNSAGAILYGATDLATIWQRYGQDRVLYVVDERQALHFKQVFAAADLAWDEHPVLEHLGFGTVQGPDGKPLKTRDGGVPLLRDLIEEAKDAARKKLLEGGRFPNSEVDPRALEAATTAVAMSALKFADLQSYRGTNYVFDLEKMISFEGRTGPYLIYAATRINSILAKVELDHDRIDIEDPLEYQLAFTLAGFNHALDQSATNRAPHHLAEYAYELAQAFSSFYATCPVKGNPSRILLTSLVGDKLNLTLKLLGIQVPTRM